MGDLGKIIENFVLFATDTSLYLQLLVVENTFVNTYMKGKLICLQITISLSMVVLNSRD